MEEDGKGQSWRCTRFYDALKERLREDSFNLMRQLNDMPNVPWLIIGDFNEILYLSKKKGGLPQRERQMQGF